MPIGSRTPGVAAGPAVIPRLLPQNEGPAPRGRIWVPSGADSKSAHSDPADGSGVVGVQFSTTSDMVWRVQRIAVSTTSSASTTATVYVGTADPANIVDISYNGNGDIADEVNPIIVPTSSILLVVWTGMSAGAIASARVQFESGSYQSGPVG